MAEADERLLNINEAEEFLNIPKGTLYQYIHEGRIPVIRISRRMVRFSPAALRAWIQNKSQEGK